MRPFRAISQVSNALSLSLSRLCLFSTITRYSALRLEIISRSVEQHTLVNEYVKEYVHAYISRCALHFSLPSLNFLSHAKIYFATE